MSAPRIYYEGEGVTLWHGDARECDAWLDADVLVTDPPYGIGWKRSLNSARSSKAHAGIANDGDTSFRDGLLDLWGARPAVVFGSFYAPSPPRLRHVCVWQKPGDAGVVGSTTGYRRDVEAVYLCGDWPPRTAAWGSVLRSLARNAGNPHSAAGRTGHPHPKPVDLMCQIIERAPPGVLAEPCAGSGSTLEAARMCGRAVVAVELREAYCEIAARRLSQGVFFAEAA